MNTIDVTPAVIGEDHISTINLETKQMPRLIITTRAGQEKTIEVDEGTTVMDAIRDNFSDEVLALCGGCCSCATCHVYVDPGFSEALPPMSDDENDLLDSSAYRNQQSRLSCQIRMVVALSGLEVRVAEHE